MLPHSPITLYPNLPCTQDELLSDVSSDFPPIKVRESSPGPPVRFISQSCRHFLTMQEQLQQSSSRRSTPQSNHSRRLDKGLGRKNVYNTVEATVRDANVGN